MKVLNLKGFLKKHKLKNDTMNETENREFIIFLFILEILKYIQTKDSLLKTMDLKEGHTGLVFISKTRNHSILIVLAFSQVNFY